MPSMDVIPHSLPVFLPLLCLGMGNKGLSSLAQFLRQRGPCGNVSAAPSSATPGHSEFTMQLAHPYNARIKSVCWQGGLASWCSLLSSTLAPKSRG